MAKNMKLGTKLLISFLAVGIIPFLLVSLIAYSNSSKALNAEAFSKLEAVQEAKSDAIKEYLSATTRMVETFSESKDVEYLYDKLTEYHKKMETKPDGPYDISTDEYKDIWSSFGHKVYDFNKVNEFYDVFLICSNHGHVMYTAEKESDLGQNLRTGKLRNSGLYRAWEGALRNNGPFLADFSPYEPSNNDPAAFIGTPIHVDGKIVGVMVIQLSIDKINHVMQERTGLGKTGETYLVGTDKLMRSDSYLDPTNHTVKTSFANPEKGKVDTKAVNEVISGRSGSDIITDYNGNPVLSVYSPINFLGETWAVIAEIDESEAFASVVALRNIIFTIFFIGIIGIIAVALLVTRSITKPINRVIAELSTGAEQVSSASGQLSSTSQQMAQGSSEQASSLEEISSSIEELTSMTKQNADNSRQANDMGKSATVAGEQSQSAVVRMSKTVEEIKEASDKTAAIIKTIDEIAMQTNLLALNAAVEAARAGDAGRGFAVVAEEVRSLAQRSAEAAKNTSELIEGVQKRSEDGVEVSAVVEKSISEITETVNKMTGLLGEVSAASSEQSQGLDQINSAVAQLDTVTQQNAANSEESASASEELSAQAVALNNSVVSLRGIVGEAAKENSTTPIAINHSTGKQQSIDYGTAGRRERDHITHQRGAGKHEVTPEQAIPFDDDEGLEDF